jgi:hypothetical protein
MPLQLLGAHFLPKVKLPTLLHFAISGMLQSALKVAPLHDFNGGYECIAAS